MYLPFNWHGQPNLELDDFQFTLFQRRSNAKTSVQTCCLLYETLQDCFGLTQAAKMCLESLLLEATDSSRKLIQISGYDGPPRQNCGEKNVISRYKISLGTALVEKN